MVVDFRYKISLKGVKMGEADWADTDINEIDITCGDCEAKWKSPTKIIDGKTVLKKPCPRCGQILL
jgi:hypothetical protein